VILICRTKVNCACIITGDLDGGIELQEVGLAHEDVLGGGAELPDLPLRELHLLRLLPLTRPPCLKETPDHVVQGRAVHRSSPHATDDRARVCILDD
jgi:hypothetical protein